MSLVPVGKKRIMVAQNESPNQWGIPSIDSLPSSVQPRQNQAQPVQTAPVEQVPPVDLNADQSQNSSAGEVKQDQQNKKESNLNNYLFSKLESFGYPPRRLEQFQEDFTSEKIFSGGVREVIVVIPDAYYGTRDRLSEKDFAQIVDDIQNKFKLTFIDGERKDKKITMNFTSQAPQQEQSEGEAPRNDDLDEVYGKRDSKEKNLESSKRRKKKASSISELIKRNKIDLIQSLLDLKNKE